MESGTRRLGYFPGCSLQATGKPYDESVRTIFELLEIPLLEVPDWNCCGATAYMNIDEGSAFALAARNLAIAEKEGMDAIVAPCPACYLALSKTLDYVSKYKGVEEAVSRGLESIGLEYEGKVQVVHPLETIVNDVGLERVRSMVVRPLTATKVFPYYGCLLVRPYAKFDDPFNPITMDSLMDALGAEVIPHPLKTKCCGGTLMETIPGIGLDLNHMLLKEARKRKADLIATTCQFCQFNLECYQDDISSRYSEDLHVPILYFTQLMGMAFGVDRERLGLSMHFQKVGPLTGR